MKLPASSWVSACDGPSSGVDTAIAAAGHEQVRTATRAIQREATGDDDGGRSRSPSRRASVGTRSGIAANSSRYAGHAGMRSRQKLFAWMSARGENPFTTRNAASQPAEQRCDRAASHAEHGDETRDRRPLRDASAEEELAHVVHLLEPVVEVEVEVAGRGRPRSRSSPRPRRGAIPSRPSAGMPPSPRSFHSARTSSDGTIATPNASPSRQRRATRYASAAPTPMSRFGGFTAAGGAEEKPGEHGVGHRAPRRASGRRRRPRRARAPSTGSPTSPSARAPAGGTARPKRSW